MTPENRQQLFQVSEKIPPTELESIYQVPVEFKGFNPTGLHVTLIDQDDVSTLLPDYLYSEKQKNYTAFDAVCIFDNNEPVISFVRGAIHGKRLDRITGEETVEKIPMVSLINFNPERGKVVLNTRKYKGRLINDSALPFPGYGLFSASKVHLSKTNTGYRIKLSITSKYQGV